MNEIDQLPKHVRQIGHVLNNFVEEGKRNVSGAYLPWNTFSEEEKKDIFEHIRSWENRGYLEIIGFPDDWPPEKVCYRMNNFIYALDSLPNYWLRDN